MIIILAQSSMLMVVLWHPHESWFWWNYSEKCWILLSGFSSYINDFANILYVELHTIYQGLILAKSLNTIELVCNTDSLHCINLLKGPSMRCHVYVVLIQDVKDLIRQGNVTLSHS